MQIFPHRDVDMWGRVWMSRFRKAWPSLNFYKEYLFGFETLVFATLGNLSMHEQLVTLQRERNTWKSHHMTPLSYYKQAAPSDGQNKHHMTETEPAGLLCNLFLSNYISLYEAILNAQ